MRVKEDSKKHPFVTTCRRYRHDEHIFPVYISINRYFHGTERTELRRNGPIAILRITYAQVSFVKSRACINRMI